MNTNQHVKNILKEHGSSLTQFAADKGYNYRTACTVAQRWWHREDKKPHGGIARQIMIDLKDYVQQMTQLNGQVASQMTELKKDDATHN